MFLGILIAWINDGCDWGEALHTLVVLGIFVGIPAVLVRVF